MFDADATDVDLVRRWQDGEGREEVFTVLQRRYEKDVVRLFFGLGFDEESAKDLAQDTFLSAFRALDGFRLDASFRTWLYQIARNAVRKRLRNRQTLKRAGEEVPFDEIAESGNPGTAEADDPLGRLVDEEERQRVRAVVDALPDSQRRVVLFRIWHGLTVREIAETLKTPEGTVKSGWARIRGALKKQLGPQFSDLPSDGGSS